MALRTPLVVVSGQHQQMQAGDTLDLSLGTGLPEAGVTNLTSDLSLKAPLASPTFTGTVVLPNSQALVTPVLGTPTSGVLTNCTGLPATALTGGLNKSQMCAVANDGSYILHVTLYAKSQNITTGAAHDIVTLTVPSGITRWLITGSAAAGTSCFFVNETQTGTMAAGTVAAFDTAGGAGVQLLATTAPAATSSPTANGWLASAAFIMSTSSSIFIRQMVASANTGTMSFYVRIYPVP